MKINLKKIGSWIIVVSVGVALIVFFCIGAMNVFKIIQTISLKDWGQAVLIIIVLSLMFTAFVESIKYLGKK